MFSRWRLHRRIFHQQFRQAAIHTYHPELLRSAHKMLFSFLQDPHNYTSHIQMLVITVRADLMLKLIAIRFTSSFILSIVYDYQPKSENDRLVRFVLKFTELAMTAAGPGATMVMETFPFRMFTHASLVCGQILMFLVPSSLTATCLVSWCHIQASVSRVSPGRPQCEGDSFPIC